MRRKVAIPIALYDVRFETRRGRPFSGLERLILDAIVDDAGELHELEQMFGVHRRIVVETVVTLVQAGWVAVTSGGDLVPTSLGVEAAGLEGVPRTTVVDPTRRQVVMMDQVGGAVALKYEASYVPRRRAENLADEILPRRVHRGNLEPLEVQHLLPARIGEWVSWIDPDIRLVSNNAHYVVGEFDFSRNTIVNVPAAFVDSLPTDLINQATSARGILHVAEDDDVAHADEWQGRWVADVSTDDLTVGCAAHHDLIVDALQHSAQTRVLIASAFVGRNRLRKIAPSLHAALIRGVDVDLVWGYDSEDSKERVADLIQIAQTAETINAPGRLTFNRSAAGSHMKVLAFDRDPGAWEVTIGSHNWLSAAVDGDTVDISITVRHPGVTAEVGRLVAESMRPEIESDGRSRSFWAALGHNLITQPEESTEGTAVTVVAGRSHEITLRAALRRARRRLLITSHQYGQLAHRRLAAASGASREDKFIGLVFIGEFQDDVDREDAANAVAECGLHLRQRKTIHAKVIVNDDEVTIGSYNFMSADAAGSARRQRELSVTLQNADIAAAVLQNL